MKYISHAWVIGLIIALLVGSFIYFVEFSGKVNKIFDYDKEVFNQLKTEYSKIESIQEDVDILEHYVSTINLSNENGLRPTNKIVNDSLNNILKLDKINIEKDIKNKKLKMLVMYESFHTNLVYAKEIFNMQIEVPNKEDLQYFPKFYFSDYDYIENSITYDRVIHEIKFIEIEEL